MGRLQLCISKLHAMMFYLFSLFAIFFCASYVEYSEYGGRYKEEEINLSDVISKTLLLKEFVFCLLLGSENSV